MIRVLHFSEVPFEILRACTLSNRDNCKWFVILGNQIYERCLTEEAANNIADDLAIWFS